jgi:hypothetical protein
MHRACYRAVGLAAVSLTVVTAAAAAKSITVRGRLNAAGYTVVALGYNGKMVTSHKRSFKLTLANQRAVTLQLVSPKGMYAGPIVVAYKRQFALEGITRSVPLGTIKILPGAGYARVVKSPAAKDIDARRRAYTRHKAPLGNGRNFGFVASRGRGASGAGLDRDQDGVPDAFDVATSGRKILNALVPTSGFSHARRFGVRSSTDGVGGATGTPPVPGTGADPSKAPAPGIGTAPGNPGPPGFNWMSQIFLPLEQTLNADATGVTTAQIDAMLEQQLDVKALDIPTADLVELDCGGLSYCSQGTSAQVVTSDDMGPNPTTAPLSSYFNAAGFPVLRGPGAAPLETTHGSGEFSLLPRATSDQIKTGDTPILRSKTGGALTQTPEPIQFVFDTVPALASYHDDAGDAGTISYPAPAGEPGTTANAIPVAANSTGDVVVTLKFWRPQRKGIPGAGEPEFMDVGHLQYTVDATSLAQNAAASGPNSPITASSCSPASVSTTDPRLSVMGTQVNDGYLVDSSNDQPANGANQLTFAIDLTKCMTDAGAPGFPVGTEGALGLKANAPNSSDHAVQNIWIKRVR